MIALTRLSGEKFVLNCELIRTIEERPDTVITLVSGDRMVVKESSKEVIGRVIDYGRHLRRLLPPS
ncbi:MAG: flagellar FlbD family protein [Phycisphaeraceae bacterium]|nr:flagellar FlbD family protein [Phycisphaerales bacterium]MCB9860546.1 flagellar FlbD family protein [Phycisphaeraceae bacterium]